MKKILYLFIALFLLSCSVKNVNNNVNNYTLSISHFNDTHTTFDEKVNNFLINNKNIQINTGSYSRLINAIEEIKSKNSNTLNLFAGDAFQIGNIMFENSGIEYDCEMLKLLQIDAMAVGNHEFDKGIDTLKGLINCIDKSNNIFPILASNLNFSDENLSNKVKPYVIKNINGRNIGIVGLSVPNKSSIGNINGVDFKDSIEVSKKIVKELTEKNTDIIIFLTHQGFVDDIKLAESVSGIDVIVGGHSHTLQGDFESIGIKPLIKDYPYVSEKNKTLIVTASAYTQNIGLIDVVFNNLGQVVSYNGNSKFLVEKNKIIEKIIENKNNNLFYVTDKNIKAEKITEKYKNKIDKKYFKEKFTTEIKLNTLRSSENILQDILKNDHSSLGNVITNIFYTEIKDIDGVTINTGSLKQNIDAGKVVEWRFMSSYPYTNKMIKFQISGKDLKTAIKNLIEKGINNDVNTFPCIAGFITEYKYNKNVEIKYIKRIKDNEIVTDNNIYTMVSTEYILNNNDEYEFSKYAKNKKYINKTDRQLIDNYFNKNNIINDFHNTIIYVK